MWSIDGVLVDHVPMETDVYLLCFARILKFGCMALGHACLHVGLPKVGTYVCLLVFLRSRGRCE